MVFSERGSVAGNAPGLAAYLGLPRQDFTGFLDFILELRASLGVPHTLEEFGVTGDRAGEIAVMA